MKNRFNKISVVFALALLASFLLASCSSKKVCPICGDEVDHLTNCDVCGSACCEYCADPDILYDYFTKSVEKGGGVVLEDDDDKMDFIRNYDDVVIVEQFYDSFVDYIESRGYVITEAGD